MNDFVNEQEELEDYLEQEKFEIEQTEFVCHEFKENEDCSITVEGRFNVYLTDGRVFYDIIRVRIKDKYGDDKNEP